MLSLQPLTDTHAIDALYRDPYIARVAHDHRPAERIDHPAVKYIGAYVGSKLFGAFLVIETSLIEIDAHALLTRSALPYSRMFGDLLLERVFGNAAIQRITAYVVDGLESARNYCLRMGFKNEGYRRNACLRNGNLLGIHILGITRSDWEKN